MYGVGVYQGAGKEVATLASFLQHDMWPFQSLMRSG
jgi:hypothetical protein